MNPNTPYTRPQWNALNEEEQQALDAVSVYLHGIPLSRGDELTDSFLSTSLRLLQPADEAYIPDDENEGDLTQAIQKKFHAIYHAGITLAHVVIIDWDSPRRYLHEWTDAMDFQFADLKAIATKVLAVRNTLGNEVLNPQRIYVVVECGIFKEAHDIPLGVEVHCLDYDVEHLPHEKLEISPIDGEACTITKFTA
ncbi:MAG: hypothetical protein EBT61_22555 [Verrucomicrobia bacterium]|nr:hypothetical protein [Verrucomicrobiota bacterium]